MKILYFAWLRNRVGAPEEIVDPPADIDTIGALIDWLRQRSDGHRAAFAQADLIRAAVNLEFADPDHPVRPEDEVAFFPPVTGG